MQTKSIIEFTQFCPYKWQFFFFYTFSHENHYAGQHTECNQRDWTQIESVLWWLTSPTAPSALMKKWAALYSPHKPQPAVEEKLPLAVPRETAAGLGQSSYTSKYDGSFISPRLWAQSESLLCDALWVWNQSHATAVPVMQWNHRNSSSSSGESECKRCDNVEHFVSLLAFYSLTMWCFTSYPYANGP